MAPDPVQLLAERADAMTLALRRLAAPIPSTKGMGPKDRADRLHAELERRIADAKQALGIGLMSEHILRVKVLTPTEKYVRDTMKILGDKHDDETINRAVKEIDAKMNKLRKPKDDA